MSVCPASVARCCCSANCWPICLVSSAWVRRFSITLLKNSWVSWVLCSWTFTPRSAAALEDSTRALVNSCAAWFNLCCSCWSMRVCSLSFLLCPFLRALSIPQHFYVHTAHSPYLNIGGSTKRQQAV